MNYPLVVVWKVLHTVKPLPCYTAYNYAYKFVLQIKFVILTNTRAEQLSYI